MYLPIDRKDLKKRHIEHTDTNVKVYLPTDRKDKQERAHRHKCKRGLNY